ncbi:MAG: hypothetical protein CL959_06005 [Euryarchaeota archaeon]|nr:hypothetical protein [Euryarchaeota archaeon]|tara:strand:- start:734 stop:2011 length:1278 start_codon:yes stop_codon:yes gene_type:complete
MSGLLSKATAAEETTQSEPVELESKTDTGLLTQSSDGPDIPTILTSVGWAIIVVGGLLSLQGGFWGLIVVIVVLVIGIGALYAGQNMSEDGVSPLKMGGAAALAILLAAGPYGVSMLMPESSFGIADVELKEDSNELSFRVIGSASEVDAVVTANGDVMWSETKSLSQDSARFNVPLEDIFIGNAWACGVSTCDVSTTQIDYMIEVTSGDLTQTTEINPEFMTREVMDSGVRITPIISQESTGDNNNPGNDKQVEGILVEMKAGLLPSAHVHEDGGWHSNTGGIWVESDYTLELVILKGNSVVYDSTDCSNPSKDGFPTIDVNGVDGISCKGDSGVSINGWFAMPGDANDDARGEYLSLEAMNYDEDGCYTFEVRIHNTFHSDMNVDGSTADGTIIDSDVKWDLDFESYNSNSDSQKPDPSMTAC